MGNETLIPACLPGIVSPESSQESSSLWLSRREPESELDSRPGSLSAGVKFFRGNDEGMPGSS